MKRVWRLAGVLAVLVLLTGTALAEPTPSGSPTSEDQAAMERDPLIEEIGNRMAGEASGGTAAESGNAAGGFPSFGALLFRVAIALLITLLVLYGAAIALKRFLEGRRGSVSSAHIRVISRAYLSPKASVYLVEVAGQVLVIGEGAGSLSLLTAISDREALAGNPRDSEKEAAQKSPASRVKAAMADFVGQLGVSRSQQSSQELKEKLREGTQNIEELKNRFPNWDDKA